MSTKNANLKIKIRFKDDELVRFSTLQKGKHDDDFDIDAATAKILTTCITKICDAVDDANAKGAILMSSINMLDKYIDKLKSEN